MSGKHWRKTHLHMDLTTDAALAVFLSEDYGFIAAPSAAWRENMSANNTLLTSLQQAEAGSRDSLGDYCKSLERIETDRRAEIGKPIYVRIDGNRFSSFTKGMGRPFDEFMSYSMIETTKAIMEDYQAVIGYTQSDEISLVFYHPEHETHHGGKYQKIVSRLASKATACFYQAAMRHGLHDFIKCQFPEFDARAFAVPDLETAAKVLFWRQIDASKNAVSMAARAHYSHKQLHGKNKDDMLEMLAAKGVDFNQYPNFFRCGKYVRRVTELRMLSPEELERIPLQHRPTEPVVRHRMEAFDMPDDTHVSDILEAMKCHGQAALRARDGGRDEIA